MAGYAAVISSGTLLAAVGYGQSALINVALFYLISSTLAVAAFLLLIELIDRIRTPGAAMLALTMEAFAVEDKPGEPVGKAISGALAFLGLAFACCALIITGLPPLSGFIAKFSLFHMLLNPGDASIGIGMVTWIMITLVVLSGLAGIISLMRFGVRTFWAVQNPVAPHLQRSEVMPITTLLLACVLLTAQAGPTMAYLERSAETLNQPDIYLEHLDSTIVIGATLEETTQ